MHIFGGKFLLWFFYSERRDEGGSNSWPTSSARRGKGCAWAGVDRVEFWESERATMLARVTCSRVIFNPSDDREKDIYRVNKSGGEFS